MEPIKGNKTDGRDSPKVAIMSHGRGGFGNVGPATAEPADATKQEVFPPLLKGRYSTGRGGEGNIMRNDAGPAVARRAQDVDNYETDNRFTDGDKLVGRGGFGNIEARRSMEGQRRMAGNGETASKVTEKPKPTH